VTEDECEVKPQQILYHTAKRLLLAQQEEGTAAVPAEEPSNLFLESKWGFDGSTGFTSFSDGDLFLSSLVPLQLQFHD